MAALPAVANEIQPPEPKVRKFRGVEKVAALILGMGANQCGARPVTLRQRRDPLDHARRSSAGQRGTPRKWKASSKSSCSNLAMGASLYGSVNEVSRNC